MRKVFLIPLLLFSFGATAQTKIGLRVGMNFASIGFNDFKPEKRMLHRLNLGTTIEIALDENWSFNTGPYYAGKGVIYGRSPSTGKIDSLTVRLNYIELPLNIGYKFSVEKDNRLAITGGPYISYGFNGEIRTINTRYPPTTHLHKKETDQYKRMELGFNFTTLYEINNHYGIRIDYSRSLSNIQRVEKEINSVIGFSAFWYFNNKEKSGVRSPESGVRSRKSGVGKTRTLVAL